MVQHKIYLCMTMLLLTCLMFYIWNKMVRLCEFVQGDLQDVRKYILPCHMCDIYFLLECVSLASCVLCAYSCYCLHWLYVNFGDLVNMEVQSRSCLDSFWCWCVHSLSLRVRLFLLTRSHYIRVSCSCKKKRMQLRLLKILNLDARVHSKKVNFESNNL